MSQIILSFVKNNENFFKNILVNICQRIKLEVEKHLRRKFKKNTWNKRHLQLVLFGRYYCKAIKPKCDNCKLKEICSYYKKGEL